MAKMPFCGVLKILPDTHRVPEFYHGCEMWMMNISHCYRSWEGFVVTAPLNTFAQLSISCFAGRVFGQVSENVDFPTKPICILDCGLLLLDVHTQTLSKTPKDTNRHTKSHKDTHRNTQTHTVTQRYTQTHTDTQRHRRTHTDTQRHTQIQTHI